MAIMTFDLNPIMRFLNAMRLQQSVVDKNISSNLYRRWKIQIIAVNVVLLSLIDWFWCMKLVKSRNIIYLQISSSISIFRIVPYDFQFDLRPPFLSWSHHPRCTDTLSILILLFVFSGPWCPGEFQYGSAIHFFSPPAKPSDCVLLYRGVRENLLFNKYIKKICISKFNENSISIAFIKILSPRKIK